MANNFFDLLIESSTVFSESSGKTKTDLLLQCSTKSLPSAKKLIAYHDSLLFTLAYPENEEIRQQALSELNRIGEYVQNARSKDSFTQSGLAFTQTDGAFSLSLVKWLIKEFPDEIFLHSADESGTHPREVFKFILPETEFELLSDEKASAIKWLEKAVGSKNKNVLIKWIINSFDKVKLPLNIAEQLYESLQLFISIKPKSALFSRTFGQLLPVRPHYHASLLKKFEEKEIISKKLPLPQNLSNDQIQMIINKSRIALALLNRETDPVTLCNEKGIKYYLLEHGISIALFSMLPDKRLPIESYIGFMMFKNGLPMAYGGGWLFGKRTLLGINIFEAFRGGESAFVFAQLLRTYKNAFGAEYFEVEPYQFGKNNPEGIHSGAFWFYYRFGFRPLNENLFLLAEEEVQKIKNQKGYRSSFETLKKFTVVNVGAHFGIKNAPINPSHISQFISAAIIKHYSGNRNTAENKANQFVSEKLNLSALYKKSNTSGFKKLSLFYLLCIDWTKCNSVTAKKLKELIGQKSNDEFLYCRNLAELNLNSFLNKECAEFISGLSAKHQG